MPDRLDGILRACPVCGSPVGGGRCRSRSRLSSHGATCPTSFPRLAAEVGMTGLRRSRQDCARGATNSRSRRAPVHPPRRVVTPAGSNRVERGPVPPGAAARRAGPAQMLSRQPRRVGGMHALAGIRCKTRGTERGACSFAAEARRHGTCRTRQTARRAASSRWPPRRLHVSSLLGSRSLTRPLPAATCADARARWHTAR